MCGKCLPSLCREYRNRIGHCNPQTKDPAARRARPNATSPCLSQTTSILYSSCADRRACEAAGGLAVRMRRASAEGTGWSASRSACGWRVRLSSFAGPRSLRPRNQGTPVYRCVQQKNISPWIQRFTRRVASCGGRDAQGARRGELACMAVHHRESISRHEFTLRSHRTLAVGTINGLVPGNPCCDLLSDKIDAYFEG